MFAPSGNHIMGSHQSSKGKYKFIPDEESNQYQEGLEKQRAPKLSCSAGRICCTILVIVIAASTGAFLGRWWLPNRHHDGLESSKNLCHSPSTRREWRSLSREEQREYVRAVQCLRSSASRLDSNASLYDDFPLVHSRMGENSHLSAPFLPWHRYFLHVYEKALKEDCAYRGDLTYWDWTLDSEDLTQSPIWDSETGFGGNGNSSDQKSIADGYCVTDGPFARMQVPFVFVDSKPHCLSRGFDRSERVRNLGRRITNQAVQVLYGEKDYESFNLHLENGAHAAIPATIRGDFSHFTAPADPVFFLHHTQLDRLWWIWQQKQLPRRLFEYAGQAAYQSDKHASLVDVIPIGGLGPDTEVAAVLSTETGLLCYRY